MTYYPIGTQKYNTKCCVLCKRKEKAQSPIRNKQKTIQDYPHQRNEHRLFTTYREQKIHTTRSNETEFKRSIQKYKEQI